MRASLLSLLGAAALAATAPATAIPVAPPDEVSWGGTAGEVVLPHRLHVDDLGIACGECHHETRAAALAMPHPEYFEDFWITCSTCHRTKAETEAVQKCSACHQDAPSTVADESLSTKVVVHRSCWRCHEVGTGGEASAVCASCHHASAVAPASHRTAGAPEGQP